MVGVQTYEAKPIFKEFVHYFYGKRLKAKEDKANNNEHLILFYKLLLNSLYGKLGQRNFAKYHYGSLALFALACMAAGTTDLDALNAEMLGQDAVKLTTPLTEDDAAQGIGTLVRFASYITASARTHLIAAAYMIPKEDGGVHNVVYADTDSLYIANNKHLPASIVGNGLGQFKRENTTPYEKMLIFGSKTYMCYHHNTDELPSVQKFKGVREMPPEMLNQMASTHEATCTLEPFFVRKANTVCVTKTIRHITDTFVMKRKIIDAEHNVTRPYATEQDYVGAVDCYEKQRKEKQKELQKALGRPLQSPSSPPPDSLLLLSSSSKCCAAVHSLQLAVEQRHMLSTATLCEYVKSTRTQLTEEQSNKCALQLRTLYEEKRLSEVLYTEYTDNLLLGRLRVGAIEDELLCNRAEDKENSNKALVKLFNLSSQPL